MEMSHRLVLSCPPRKACPCRRGTQARTDAASSLAGCRQTKKEKCLGGEGGWLFQASRPWPWDELGRVPEALSWPALDL